MQDFEKLGVFYLGRDYDLATKSMKENLLLYDSKDLVTHMVCVGMTGSGKTGLCISLLEEAALDGVPAIVIDPKGDMTNLMLTFPELRKEDFLPWVNAEDAAKKGMSVEDYAAKQADSWRNGLASWGEDGERIRRLRSSCDFTIYTPGSNAGTPVSILKSFAAPPAEIIDDDELLQERINTTVTSLLGLIGVEGDPIRSREHILISTILSEAWRKGSSLDLAGLIQQIQSPPVRQIGVLELESFYPSKARFELAMQINNLLAAPGFRLWMEGEPLDVKGFLYTPSGKPRISIFSIAHLSDAQRMFFVSLLLNHVVGWMRTQSGTTSLRAILYIDEVFGYLPPIANPPSKLPLLTLMKQARAFGLGVALVTQNPVDLDYKSLSNTGTWFIGRLQTDRDKIRVLDALEGVSTGTGKGFDRSQMDQVIAGLGNRVFLMHNVHDDAPSVFTTRWAMSYLCGPLTREQIKVLMDPLRSKAPVLQPLAPARVAERAPAGPAAAVPAPGSMRPVLPSEIPQYFLPPSARGQGALVYRPMVLGVSHVRFADAKRKIDQAQDMLFLAPLTNDPLALSWDSAKAVELSMSDLSGSPLEPSRFSELPPAASKPKSYSAWQKEFSGWLARSQKLELLYSPGLQQLSRPGEKESDFRIRMQLAAREANDGNMEKLRKKYAPKYAALDERIRRGQVALEKEREQASRQKYQSAVSLGSSILGAVVGRKSSSAASRTVRDYGKISKEKKDVEYAGDNLEALQKQRQRLEEEFQAEVRAMGQKMDPLTERLETVSISPKKTDIVVKLVALVWRPEGV
ncbi:MAG: DUF87 domain-containing protein [Methanomassiliicoccales archaeon]|jgi:hypothetical protein|nr:DUF87 domain-containing protein [Methanomassiliicoccales archaeon]